MSLEENIAAIECIDYDKMYEDLRDNLNLYCRLPSGE